MTQPPRLKEILLDPNEPVVYFVTLCVEARLPKLANADVHSGITSTLEQMRRWRTLGGVIMPDHIHLIVAPMQNRLLPVSDFSAGFKRLLRKALPRQNWEWQKGCFDRLMRSCDNLQDKWAYVRENPVRAGLVHNVTEWPFYLGPLAEHAFVGEAVSLPMEMTGNLTGSPTTAQGPEGKLTASPTAAEAGRS